MAEQQKKQLYAGENKQSASCRERLHVLEKSGQTFIKTVFLKDDGTALCIEARHDPG